MSRLKHRVRSALRLAVSMSTLAVVAAFAAIGVGLALGYRPVVITTGSMAPTAPTGSVVVARPVADVQAGDLLVMRGEGRATVTHRVVEIERNPAGGRYAITRGDANSSSDAAPYLLGRSELVGRWVVPGLGRVLTAVVSPIFMLGFLVLVAGVIAASALLRIWQQESEPPNSDPVEEAPPTAIGEPTSVGASRPVTIRSAGIITAVVVFLGSGGVAGSLYFGGAAVGSNLFSSSECYDARLGSVQSGQLVNTASGVQTETIAAVDPSTSFLLFSTSSSAAGPNDSAVMGTLASGTTIEFTRQTVTGSPSPIAIEWSVVEYSCGVSVQRGVTSGSSSNQIDVPITPIDPAASFVMAASVPPAGDLDFGADDLQIVELVGSDIVRLRADPSASLSAGRGFAWQVVTFTSPGDAAVQNVGASLGSGTSTTTISLPTPVDPATTMVLSTTASPESGPDIGERMVRVRLVDATTVEVTRLVGTGSIDVSVQVVELRDGSVAQRGVVDLGIAEFDKLVAIAPVDLSRSVAFSSVMVPGSVSGGATDHVGDDVVGEASVAVSLDDSTTVSVSRATAGSVGSFPWQVITWGGPSWADPLSPFRQRIDITAGGVDAPDGYSTSLTLDHASLVSSGLALSSGDDARIWRYDGTSWTELDRILEDGGAWNTADTTIWFRTQEPIQATESISYWLYFGNPSPPPVLADPANVWLLQEGFEDGTLGQFEDRTAGTGWYRALPWTRRIVVTIDRSTVSENLTDQRVLVRVTDADLGANAQADGSDVRFTAADGVTVLPHEIEDWNPGTGSLTAWVRVPTVSASADTVLHLYYGAADAPQQQRPRSVWSEDVAVWHLNRDPNGPAPTLDDVGTHGSDGLAVGSPTLVSTASGPAADLDGSSDRFEAPSTNAAAGPFTVAAWFRIDTASGDPVIVSQGDPSTSGSFELAIDASVTPTGRFRISSGGSMHEILAGSISLGSWHHLVATWDGSNATLYLDGPAVGSTAAAGSGLVGTGLPVVLGGDAAGVRTFDGLLGEVHIDRGAWTGGEVEFHEANLRSPATTVSAGAPSTGVWFDQGDWNIRRPLVIARGHVAGPLTDFPLLVQLSDVDLASNAQADGDDLVFVAADGVTRLDHQLESWNATTGALSAWVRIPTLNATTDTGLFLYLRNGSATDQSDPIGVWGPETDLVLLGD